MDSPGGEVAWMGAVTPNPPTQPADESALVRSGYDRWAPVYDHDANPLLALEGPRMWDAVGDVRGLNVLDLGCGTGRHAVPLAAAGARVTAVDFSDGMLAEARRKAQGAAIRFVAHDLHDPLPFTGGDFDVVVSRLALEHLRDLDRFFGEAHRALRPGGRGVVSAAHPALFLRDSRARFTDPASGEFVEPGSLPHQIDDFVKAALGAGFRLQGLGEYAPDARFASRYPRAAKYVGWPMLVVLSLAVASHDTAPGSAAAITG